MEFKCALIQQDSLSLALIQVDEKILNNSLTAYNTALDYSKYFPGVPIVLASDKDGVGKKYYGRKDIIKYLKEKNIEEIPWKTFSI